MLLEIHNLFCDFFLEDGVFRVLDGVSLQLDQGETLAVVGESGSGKTMLGLSILGLLPTPARIVGGDILYKGKSTLELDGESQRTLRGREIGFVPQEPAAAWNPVFTIGYQITEVLRLHRGMSRGDARAEAVRLLTATGLPEPERQFRSYPFQLSGGMQQRAFLALAISCRPRLLIADEPTTALDATLQLGILELLQGIQQKLGMAMILISHDLGVVSRMAGRTAVLYAGRVVESGPTGELLSRPLHPYTLGLRRSVPTREPEGKVPLQVIPGAVPGIRLIPPGCAFHPRCSWATETCTERVPPLITVKEDHASACARLSEIEELHHE